MSETVILGIQPTFYLKKIDPLSIPQKFMNGAYKNITFETIQSWKKVSKETSQPISVIGTNKLDKIFTYSDRNNNVFTCITTNNLNPGANQICYWCRDSFSHPWIGIPYRLEQSISKNYYYTDGCYCSFECASAEMDSMMKKSIILHGGLLTSPNILLKLLFHAIYPHKHLKSAPHFSYHERNGGALSDNEYYESRSYFLETSGIVILPFKKVVIKMNV
jgi:hypothetical protein